MASPDTPRSRSRSHSSTGSSDSSDTTMNDAPPLTPARPRPSHGTVALQTPGTDNPVFFRLMALPRELRDRIYVFALVSPFVFWWPSPSSPVHDVALGLVSVSRQVHEEATPILYTHNRFLFTHPSDCNIFRFISSPFSANLTSVYFRIREKDVKLWKTYLGSKQGERSMKADLPKLKTLWIFLRVGTMGTPHMIGQLGAGGGNVLGGGGNGVVGGLLNAGLAAQFQNMQNVLGGQINAQMTALQQQVQNQISALQQQVHQALGHPGPQPGAYPGPFSLLPLHTAPHPHQNAPPQNPSPLVQLTTQQLAAGMHNQPHPLYASFLRWEREMGLDQLCLALHETRPADADVKVVCIVKLPKLEVQRLLRVYPEELSVDRNGDVRTRFRKVHGVEVSLEVSGYEVTA
ncbi:hypothetical protein P280DRAFT_548588 [Massarina eburnea CBS 473.64]|uniref:Uncharacterized protein n=1 Tax=Massarina eburnea CBS 473.64 TaxID=1395130 RepID=A0A6A6S730_9PLEO|nr:hypothetical protein P280DRAFT_548588 [Massarina eburnea CBS 473.64]